MCALSAENLVVVGDFNLVMDTSIDRLGSSQNKIKAAESVRKHCEELFLCEIWRTRNEGERRYSWSRSRPKLIASRIDFSLLSVGMSGMCENVGYTTGLHTDHLAHFVFLNLTKSERGRGYWKLNTLHLQNKE